MDTACGICGWKGAGGSRSSFGAVHPKNPSRVQGDHNGLCPQILGSKERRTHGPGCCGEAQAVSLLPVPPHSHHNPAKLISFQPLENKIFPSLIREADSHYYVK